MFSVFLNQKLERLKSNQFSELQIQIFYRKNELSTTFSFLCHRGYLNPVTWTDTHTLKKINFLHVLEIFKDNE